MLPRGLPPHEMLPLILVGRGATLRLRNCVLVNSASLAACLQLGPGARLLAREEDGVRVVPASQLEDEFARWVGVHGGECVHAWGVLKEESEYSWRTRSHAVGRW